MYPVRLIENIIYELNDDQSIAGMIMLPDCAKFVIDFNQPIHQKSDEKNDRRSKSSTRYGIQLPDGKRKYRANQPILEYV